jgi:hemolysin activation/secretion protein
MEIIMALSLIGGGLLPGGAMAAGSLSSSDAGLQLQQAQQSRERERIEKELAEQREKKPDVVENQQNTPKSQQGALHFVLRKVNVDSSAVLPDAERERIVQPYLGKEVTVDDLYAITAAINQYYQNKQYLTCRAYLPAQKVHEGQVHIALFEGRNGTIAVEKNKDTRSDYILQRFHIVPGSIESMDKLNKELRWFNGTNDVKLHIALQAGKAPGTTDYVLQVQEPSHAGFTLYGDNAGSESTGRWREGIFYTDRSLTGWRDSLTLGLLRTQGMDSFSMGYSVPVSCTGTKLGLSYSTNGTKVVDGQYHDLGLAVRGHAASYGLSVTQPLALTDSFKAEASLGWQRQHSVTDIEDISVIDDTFTDYTAALALTNYGRGWAFFQRHAFTCGKWDNESLTRQANPSADYNMYNFTGIYQRGAAYGQLLNLRANLQWSGTNDLRPSKQFFLGGIYSVRGYQENLVGGDNGYTLSVEYAVPLRRQRDVSMYGFFDYGNLWGDSSYEQHVLAGTGIGLRATLAKDWSLDCALAFPLRRDLDGGKADANQLHLSLRGQF